MANIVVSWIPVDFDINSPDWLLRNHLSRIFTLHSGIQRVFIDPAHEGTIGVVWSSDASTVPVSYLDNLRSWTFNDVLRPAANNSDNNSNTNQGSNSWNYSELRDIPRNSQNVITMNNIQDGNRMINFHDRYRYGQFFKKSTYNSLPRTPETNFMKVNPFTREPIDENYVRPYTARIVGGYSRKNIKRRKNTRRKRNYS